MITMFLASITAIAVPVSAEPKVITVDDNRVECPDADYTRI